MWSFVSVAPSCVTVLLLPVACVLATTTLVYSGSSSLAHKHHYLSPTTTQPAIMATPNNPSTTLHQDTKDHQISHLEHGHTSDDEKKSLEDDPLTYFTPEEQKKIIHRLDRRLVVVVGVMYCVSLMDRTNLSNAAIAGMSVELKLGVEMRYVS